MLREGLLVIAPVADGMDLSAFNEKYALHVFRDKQIGNVSQSSKREMPGLFVLYQ